MNFEIEPHPAPTSPDRRAELLRNPGFGTLFTDHMALVRWTEAEGWHDARITARRPFQLDPACSVLHYAQEIFEGMKAYRTVDGRIALFRPEQNARRFVQSARRMAMAELPEDIFLDAVEKLVLLERDWIPDSANGSLYLRPFMFADDVFLGVRPASSFTFCVIASPAGAYFKGKGTSIRLWASPDYSRAGSGGTGAAKCGGNYAGSLVAQRQASEHGCDQVVFLDAAERRWIEELGGMNIFFLFDDGTLRTPPLNGNILPGITRASLIELARGQGMTVEEAPYSIDDWRADAASGRLKEAFACGTAAVVTAIGAVIYGGEEFRIGDGERGPVTTALRDRLVGLQRGEIADERGWLRLLD